MRKNIKSFVKTISDYSLGVIGYMCHDITFLEYEELPMYGYEPLQYDLIKRISGQIDTEHGTIYWMGGELFKMKVI